MQSKPRSNSIITTALREGNVVFSVKGAGDLVVRPASLSDANRTRAMVHGIVQKVSDKAAIDRNKETFAKATPQEKYDAMKVVVEHLNSGSEDWSPARSNRVVVVKPELDPMIIAAVCEATGKGEEVIRANIAAAAESRKCEPAAVLAAFSLSAKVKPILERLRAEAAIESDLDGDDMLSEIEGAE